LCPHRHRRIVWTEHDRHGERMHVRQVRQQCADCGALGSRALPHGAANDDTPSVDLDALRRAGDAAEAGWRARAAQRLNETMRRQGLELAEWRREHEKYLVTDEWRRRRGRVMLRANGICEGCGEWPATQVHHLTYAHWRAEFLWELRAVCDECHTRV